METIVVQVAGGVATASVLGLGVLAVGYLRRIDSTMRTVEMHLKVNGSEKRLPEHLRGLGLRDLVIEHIVTGGVECELYAAHKRRQEAFAAEMRG